MPVKGRLKSRVGSNPREALFRKFREMIKKSLKIIKFHRKIMKFYRKIMKNHEISSKNHEISWNFIEKSSKIMKFHRKNNQNWIKCWIDFHSIPGMSLNKTITFYREKYVQNRCSFWRFSEYLWCKNGFYFSILWCDDFPVLDISLAKKRLKNDAKLFRWLAAAACCCWLAGWLAGWTSSGASIFNS